MKIEVMLAVPKKNDSINELKYFLSGRKVDLYVFPEGFLTSDTIDEALRILKSYHCDCILGFKDLHQQKAIVIEDGIIVDEYTKVILTKGEKRKGKIPGEQIRCVNTKFGKIGVPICYEIHFPELVRVMRLEHPAFMLNIIGTGMHHELQYDQWTTLAKARAIENEIYVLGCSHHEGRIPLAFVYTNSGEVILEERNGKAFVIEVDLNMSNRKQIGYLEDRCPEFFRKLSDSQPVTD